MATISLVVNASVAQEILEYANRHGFPTGKALVTAYLKDCIKHERLDKLREQVPSADTVTVDDVNVT